MRMTRDYEEPLDEGHWTADTLEQALSLPPEMVELEPELLEEEPEPTHPIEAHLRTDRLPHIWCPGCGIGIAVSCFVQALEEAEVDFEKLSAVSGIGCTGRVAGYMGCDSFHTTHGRAIPFALGLHLGNPELKVVVISGDGDLIAIGGNHLIHAARRNADLTVFCVNNFTYGMTGGQGGPTTQGGARTTTTPYGNVEHPFNLPQLVAAAGATYVARWTVLDLGRLRRSMVEALQHRGFAFVEIVSPCPTYYGRRNRLGEAIDELRYYREHTAVENFAQLEDLDLGLSEEIKVGKFVETERPTFGELLHETLPSAAQAAAAAR
jgi:2-oxoglutarate ferredoxin oxidoreductase subunit beta